MLCISKNLKINEEKENVISKDIVFYPTSTNEKNGNNCKQKSNAADRFFLE